MDNKYGFIEPFITKDNFVLGGYSKVPKEVLKEDGQWDDFLVVKELQNLHFETYNCTGFGTNSAIEMLMKRKFGFEPNYSDRATGIISGTFPPGNDPGKVADSIYVKGLFEEFELPFSSLLETVDDYYKPSPLSDRLLEKGKEWKRKYIFMHEWVEGDANSIKEALKYSPLGVAVCAWLNSSIPFIYTKPTGMPDNHWTILYGFDDNIRAWKIYDSYDQTLKLYSYDAEIKWVKRYYVAEQLAEIKKNLDILQVALDWLKKAVALFLSTPAQSPKLPVVENKVVAPVLDPIVPPIPQNAPNTDKISLSWNTKDEVRHSIRVIGDKLGVGTLIKDLACDVCLHESNYNPKAKNVRGNKPSTSVDRGLFMINSHWHAEVIDEQAYNPEWATKWFYKAIKDGHIGWWSASLKNWNKTNKYNSLLKV